MFSEVSITNTSPGRTMSRMETEGRGLRGMPGTIRGIIRERHRHLVEEQERHRKDGTLLEGDNGDEGCAVEGDVFSLHNPNCCHRHVTGEYPVQAYDPWEREDERLDRELAEIKLGRQLLS